MSIIHINESAFLLIMNRCLVTTLHNRLPELKSNTAFLFYAIRLEKTLEMAFTVSQTRAAVFTHKGGGSCGGYDDKLRSPFGDSAVLSRTASLFISSSFVQSEMLSATCSRYFLSQRYQRFSL